MYKAQLDVASSCELHDLMSIVRKNSTSECAVGLKLIEASGPGGGNPVFEFSHTNRYRIVSIIKELTDETDPKFINSLIN